MELDRDVLAGIELMEGELVDCAITVAAEDHRGTGSGAEALVLTTSRLIHVSGRRSENGLAIIAVDDVDSVELVTVKEGISPFVWAALAAVLSIILYSTIEHDVVRVVLPLGVLAMGAYLLVSRLLDSGRQAAVFRAGATAISWSYDGEGASSEVQDLINRLFSSKARGRADGRRSFAPR